MALDPVPTPGLMRIGDGAQPGTLLTVAAFHNGDQTNLNVGTSGGPTNSIVTSGPSLLINAAGLADRQREGAADGVSVLGVPGDVPYQLFQITASSGTGAVAAAGAATITPGAMSGNFNGCPWSITLGTTIVYDFGGANQEVVTVTAVTATTFTATFANTHSAGVVMLVDVLNRQRDAAGEWRGANGQGTAVALDYQSIAGGPNGTQNYEPEVQVVGLGVATGALTTANQGASSVVFTAAPTGLRPGDALWLIGGTAEMVYVAKTYVAGNTTVPLQSAIVRTSHTSAQWNVFAINGPGAAPFYPLGCDVDGIALSDPVNGVHTQWRQAPGNLGAALVNSEGSKATFRYGAQGFTPQATPTAMLIIQGSATKTVRIKRLKISGAATAAGNMQLQLQRWSTAGTQGSAALTALTAGKHDVNDAAATAVVSTVGTANYTTQGTGFTVPIGVDRIQLPAAGTGVGFTPLTWDFARSQDKPLILRGAADFLVIGGNGSAVPAGGTLDFEIETEEDNS